MGLLSVGEPLSWSETKYYAEHVRQHGIQQFINLYNLCKSKTNEVLKFGDEIEYMIVEFDDVARKVRVSNTATILLELLQQPKENGIECASLWHPEFGAYMVEGTPGNPYTMNSTRLEKLMKDNQVIENCPNNALQTFSFLNVIEANMRLRRKQILDLLKPNETVLSISPFPMLGTFDFCTPASFVHPTYGYGRSLFFPDEAIFSGHPRFKTLVNNIRERRGKNVGIYLPIYRDLNTPNPFRENFVEALNVDQTKVSEEEWQLYNNEAKNREDNFRKDDQIYMDAMGFGMGCCCLQVTFQASNIEEACILYDQLAPLCPIMMALSAASPIFRGYLADVDCRWSVISQSVDDRTDVELTGFDAVTGNKHKIISKSRFDSIDLYISPENVSYNDIDVVFNEEYYTKMIESNIPPSIAKHIAHLFIRDPLVLFKEKLDINDDEESDHFENIQSTNWQTMRFKPPPLNSLETGWRVEFRPMEVQLTDYENAAFIAFVVLLTRLFLSFNLDILIPMSKVDENMKVAQKRDAVRKERFWFRRDISFPLNVHNHFFKNKHGLNLTSDKISKCFSSKLTKNEKDIEPCYVQLSIDEIINGTNDHSETNFPGLIPLLNFYLDTQEINAGIRCTLRNYLGFISKRAQGKIPTTAQIIRQYVTNHEEYKKDSRVTNGIIYDLLKDFDRLQKDEITIEEFIKMIEDQQENDKLNVI